MTKLKAGLIGSLAVLGVGASLLLQEQRQSRLREANETLRQRLDLLTAENDGLSNRLASATSELSRSGVEKLELMKLRSEVGELRRKYLEQQRLLAKEKEAQRKEAVESAAVPKRLTRDQWAFAGYQTPANALESMMWAMKNGDLGAFLSSMTPEAQAAVTKHFEGMTDADISAALQKESAGLPELQFDRIKTDSDTEAIYVLSTQDTDNGAQRTHDEAVIRLRNIGGEWKSGEGL